MMRVVIGSAQGQNDSLPKYTTMKYNIIVTPIKPILLVLYFRLSYLCRVFELFEIFHQYDIFSSTCLHGQYTLTDIYKICYPYWSAGLSFHLVVIHSYHRRITGISSQPIFCGASAFLLYMEAELNRHNSILKTKPSSWSSVSFLNFGNESFDSLFVGEASTNDDPFSFSSAMCE